MNQRHQGESERTRANLLQIGLVAEADYSAARVRVALAGLKTAWLPWLTGRAGGNRSWAAPEVGEQVLVACPDGDPAGGVVLGAIYQADHAAPAASADLHRMVYSDGAVIEYDRQAHRLAATLPSGATAALTAPGGVTITGPTQIVGTLTVTQAVTAQATLAVTGAATLSSTLAVTGAATMASTLGVSGALTGAGGSFSMSGSVMSLTGSLSASGEIAGGTLKMGGLALSTSDTPNVRAGA